MKSVIYAIAVAIPLQVSAAEDGWPAASEYTIENCSPWTGEAVMDCKRNGKSFVEYYERAIKGDLKAQRMMAMVFSAETPGIVTRPALACAWSEVVVRSGHLLADDDDTRHNKQYCDRLTAEERKLALAQADRMLLLLRK